VTLSTKVTGQSTVGIGEAVDVTIGGPAVIASTDAQEQQANRQSDSGPTCRLASFPEAGPGATVGTLSQGYPLLRYKDTVRRTAPRPHHMGKFRGATWQGKIIHLRVHYRVRTPAEEHRTPVCTARAFDYSPGLPRRYAGSLRWAPGSSE
jgi:hypothetical protein